MSNLKQHLLTLDVAFLFGQQFKLTIDSRIKQRPGPPIKAYNKIAACFQVSK